MRWRRSSDLAVFHEFLPAPTGGGSQFLRALVGELERRGLRVARNRLPRGTRACLFNSFNFDFERLRRSARPDVRLVHRVDGPVQAVRGVDDGTDERIRAINAELARATVLQSRYSLRRHEDLGLELREPHVIPNAVDPAIFHADGRTPLATPVRLVMSSWSDNPRKGAGVFRRLEDLLDPARYELTFVGRSQERFERARVLPPLPSRELADELRRQHVFVAPFRDEPCSNALLEALACGLPALYLASGGNGELVGEAGFAFSEAEEIPGLLERLVAEWDDRRAAVNVPSLDHVAGSYLEVLGL
jgi:glycosyltransferase involved in cell wall biosynthesis